MSNSAARLHQILTLARQSKLQNSIMTEAWREILKLPTDTDELLVMSKVGKVYTLPSIISAQIGRYKDLDQSLYLGWRNDLTMAFRTTQFGAAFSNFTQQLKDSLLINIKFCAHELDKKLPEKNLTKEALDDLRQSCWALYEKILASEIGPPIDRYLLDNLYRIIDAIDDYQITGATALESALSGTVGSIALNPDFAQASRKSEFGEEFWNCVGKASLLLSVAKSAAELTDKVQHWLGSK